MFNNQRYLTKGVNETISLDTQIAIWDCIDKLEIEKDYLQVFDLIPKSGFTFIIHKQEHPEYIKEWILEVSIEEAVKIFVIDDGEYSTMMLSYEY